MLKMNLKGILEKTISVEEYIEKMASPFKENFLRTKKVYRLNEVVVSELKRFSNDFFVIVFSAEWCKDCAANVPVLALLSNEAGLRVNVFGGLKTNPLNNRDKWRVPPSPEEVNVFNVQKIPHIMILGKEGKHVGTIIEKPQAGKTLEEEILQILKTHKR